MKGRFKFPSDSNPGSLRSGCKHRLKTSPGAGEITNQFSILVTRLTRAALIVPFVMSGMGYFPQVAQAQIVNRGTNGCPAGTRRESNNNILINGDFSQGYTGFTSDLPIIGPVNSYGEGYSIVNDTTAFIVNLGGVIGVLDPKPFPGDPANNVPPSNSFYYSNPSNGDYARTNGRPILWQQTVTVQPNTTYNLLFYIDNLLRVNAGDPASGQNPDSSGYPPVIEASISDGTFTTVLAPPAVIRNTPDQWVAVQIAFTTGPSQTSATLSVRDVAGEFFGTNPDGSYRAVFGDDFGFTAVSLNKCIPIPVIRKSVRRLRDNDNNGVLNVGDDLQYTITVTNTATSGDITELVISDAIPTQLQVLRDANNPIQFPAGFAAAASLPSSSFNGTGTPITLTTPGNLAAGQSITLTYNARIQPGATSPIVNQARANFSGDGGQPILSDASDSTNPTQPGSGTNPGVPDSNGNINQPNAGAADPTVVNLGTPSASGGSVILVKRITAANRNGVPISGVAFGDVETDTDADAINQAGLRPVGVREIPATTPLRSGDDVQYTIYFLTNQALTNFNFCDLIPQGTTYIPNTISIAGAGTGADQGRYFSPLTPITQVAESRVCENRNNTNGTVIVNLGNVPNGRTGSVSLRVRIN